MDVVAILFPSITAPFTFLLMHLIVWKWRVAHAHQEVSDGKCWCTVMQHFSMGQFCTCNTPHHWWAAAEVSGSRKLPVIPCWFNSPGLELVKYSMYRCFKKHISGACPALDMLTPGREHSPLSLTSHLFPGQKKSNIHHVLNVLNIVCSTFSSTRGMN